MEVERSLKRVLHDHTNAHEEVESPNGAKLGLVCEPPQAYVVDEIDESRHGERAHGRAGPS